MKAYLAAREAPDGDNHGGGNELAERRHGAGRRWGCAGRLYGSVVEAREFGWVDVRTVQERLRRCQRQDPDPRKSSPLRQKFTSTITLRDNTMAAPTSVQDAPTTPQDARRKRKAKDSSSSKHDAKRIRTQDEKNAAASGTKQIKTETALAIVGDKNTQTVNQDAGDVVKTKLRPDRSSWYTSEPAGGRFLPIDPVFSKDERYDGALPIQGSSADRVS